MTDLHLARRPDRHATEDDVSLCDMDQAFGWSTTGWYLAGSLLLLVTVFVVAMRRRKKRRVKIGSTWQWNFDVTDDGRVHFRTTDIDTGLVISDVAYTPENAEKIAAGLQAQAERARRLFPAAWPEP